MIEKKDTNGIVVNRPFFFGILCFAVLVYSGFISILFILGTIFSTWTTDVINNYLPERNIDEAGLLMLTVTGTVMFLSTFIGAVFLWKMRRSGFYLFTTSTMLIIIFPYIIGLYNIITSVIFLIIIILFTLYFKKLKK